MVGVEQADNVEAKVSLEPDNVRVGAMQHLFREIVCDVISTSAPSKIPATRMARGRETYLDPFGVGEELVERFEPVPDARFEGVDDIVLLAGAQLQADNKN